jgi:hypothetical protein
MKFRFITILFLVTGLIPVSGYGQTSFTPGVKLSYTPTTRTVFYKIGETQIPVKLMQYGEVKDIVYINLHADEITSIQAAKLVLEKEGGTLIKIENNNKRNIRFRLKGRYYQFDPNRMFSREGVVQTLTRLGRISPDAIAEVERFGKRILDLIPKNPSILIALHNNTDGLFGIQSYLPGKERESDAKKVYADPGQDPDDIFLTTDSLFFEHLAAQKYNSVWQDNGNARKDGSLSIYCGERDITYLNCETQHGRSQQYVSMLIDALTHLQKQNSSSLLTYQFNIDLSGGETFVSRNNIYFGDEIIGQVISLDNNTSSSRMKGQLQLRGDFVLQSNMDFFMFPSPNGDPRIELRMDPTREGRPVNPQQDTLTITIRK